MFTHFLNILATVISVVSLLIVTYGALVAFISFLGNELIHQSISVGCERN